MNAPDPHVIIDVRDVTKGYHALRPLRVKELRIAKGDRAVLLGFDALSAEVFVNLLTGAALPDAGEICVFGRSTALVPTGDEWLALVDRFGIVSERVVLLEDLTVVQNLAIPLTLDLDPLPAEMIEPVRQLARDVGITDGILERRVRSLDALDRARLRLARAIALDPQVLLMEHPTATLSTDDASTFAAVVLRLAKSRALTVVAFTADARLAGGVDARAWTWQPATGVLSERSKWARWFG